MIKRYKNLLLIPLLAIAVGCNEDKIDENPSGEAYIYNFQILNGDIGGTAKYDGIFDAENRTVEFTIPTESDIQHIKFGGKLSLGANIEFDSYDFSESLTQPVNIVNVENRTEYTVKLNLLPATISPFVDQLIVTRNDGTSVTAYISMTDKTIYLKVPNENEVTISSLKTKPVRATATFTAAQNNKLLKTNPGSIKLDFLGLKDEYAISFGNIPEFGANFKLPTIFDFSANPVGNAGYADFAEENTRSADFDGKHALIISRQGGNSVKLLKREDLEANSAGNPILLNLTGVTGGTYIISAGRLSHGHIYVANLTTGLANTAVGKLKIYHWASPTSAAETVFDFDGVISAEKKTTNRYGDNISVNLDENGNGYIFCVSQAVNEMLRLTVSNFTTVSEPTVIVPDVAATYYATVNQVDGVDGEYVYTSTRAAIMLIDKDGKILYQMADGTVPGSTTDVRIINYNYERYLIATTGHLSAATGPATFYVYNITEGFNTTLALQALEKSKAQPVFSFSLESKVASAYAANTGWGIVNDDLYMFSAAPRSGFSLFHFPKK